MSRTNGSGARVELQTLSFAQFWPLLELLHDFDQALSDGYEIISHDARTGVYVLKESKEK